MSHGLWCHILTMSLLPFWALNVSVALLSMEGQKALGFHQKYLNLCSEDERRSESFGTTWGWVINNRIFIFGWTIPFVFHKGITNHAGLYHEGEWMIFLVNCSFKISKKAHSKPPLTATVLRSRRIQRKVNIWCLNCLLLLLHGNRHLVWATISSQQKRHNQRCF